MDLPVESYTATTIFINCGLLDNLSHPIITHNHFPDVLTNDRCYERRPIRSTKLHAVRWDLPTLQLNAKRVRGSATC